MRHRFKRSSQYQLKNIKNLVRKVLKTKNQIAKGKKYTIMRMIFNNNRCSSLKAKLKKIVKKRQDQAL